jgi:unsaturated chondroitin disaccharide hydrolase
LVVEDALRLKGEQVFEFASNQLRHLVETYPDSMPSFTVHGKWQHQMQGWTNWCEGFLGGQLWLVYLQTGDEWFRKKAEYYSRLVEARKTDHQVHDLGFIFIPTWKRWYDLTGDEAINNIVIEAGRTLAMRFQEKGGYVCSFEGPQSLYIDIMMNIGLVFYAAKQTGARDLWRIADQHCLTTRRRLVRGDGSTAHEGIFDPETGIFLHQSTKQGWRGDSSWARGLTWALYGFGSAYRFTNDLRYLVTSEALANYYIEQTPPHGLPPNDWAHPQPELPYDSSAAAIAAAGMWQLSKLTGDPLRARYYRQYAFQILDTLTEPKFIAFKTPGWEGILFHGIYHLPESVGVDESTSWGDYYLLEALWMVLSELRN